MEDIVKAIEKLSEKNIVDYLLIIIPILISIFALIVSIQTTRKQNKLQNDVFCFELFERRLHTYDALKRIICRAIEHGEVTRIDLNEFLIEKKDVPFLFGDDICEIYNSIYTTMVKLRTLEAKIEHNITHESQIGNHSDLCEDEEKKWWLLTDQTNELAEKIKKYISFAEYKIEKD